MRLTWLAMTQPAQKALIALKRHWRCASRNAGTTILLIEMNWLNTLRIAIAINVSSFGFFFLEAMAGDLFFSFGLKHKYVDSVIGQIAMISGVVGVIALFLIKKNVRLRWPYFAWMVLFLLYALSFLFSLIIFLWF